MERLAVTPVTTWLWVAVMTVLLHSRWRDVIARYYWLSAFDIEAVRNILCQSNATAFYCTLSKTFNGLWAVL